jgi:adenine-specific DNA-methyltransferase
MAKSKYDNYSKEQLIAKLEKLEKKGYGMVWEDKPEKIADKCEKELPVLVEDKKREIKKDSKKPTHFIFEGDNYHTLYTLNFTHKKGIDVIYIDPPYNTGKTDKNGVTDFRYNDRFIKKEDRFRHSTWLSFMNKRLRLAKNLLKDSGVIAISIDDNEVFNLKLLCDKIFGELNHIATVPTIMNLKGNQDQFGFAGTHEYTLFYGKNKLKVKLNDFEVDEKELEKWVYDDYGIYKKGANLKATGGNAPRSKRPNLYYPIFINTSNELYVTENDKKLNNLDYELLPTTDGNEMSWRWEKDTVKRDIHNIILVGDNENYSIYKKQRPKLGDIPTKKPKSIFYKPEYSSGNGTTQLKKIFNGKKTFNNPKPLELIKDILHVCSTKNSVILDFFAGSSTSGHAVLELNNEDGGKRQVILCTNNENNICEEVTYPRMQNVINGYNDVEGIPANLKYFKTDYVPIVLTDNDKRNLVAKSTELLCITENTFEKILEDSKQNEFSIFKNDKQHTAIIYDEDYIENCCVQLNKLKSTKDIIIYVFSYDHNYMEEDFENLNKVFKVKPIPEVILNVYRKISKLKNK